MDEAHLCPQLGASYYALADVDAHKVHLGVQCRHLQHKLTLTAPHCKQKQSVIKLGKMKGR